MTGHERSERTVAPEQSYRVRPPVMCAVDASDEGVAVAWAGARMAELLHAPLVLFHVHAASRWNGVDQLLHPQRQVPDRGAGRTLLQERAGALPVAATLELSSGVPADEVLAAADDMDPALLVLGSRGSAALRALLGSVSQDVAKYASRPTLIVPDGSEGALLSGGPVVCGLDDSSASERAAASAADLAAALRTEVVIVSIADVVPTAVPVAPAALPATPEPPDLTETRKQELRGRAARVADKLAAVAPSRVVIDEGDPASSLSAIASELEAPLIALGTVQRSPLAAVLNGSTSSALLSIASHPVLHVP